jgi:hypothetical protein
VHLTRVGASCLQVSLLGPCLVRLASSTDGKPNVYGIDDPKWKGYMSMTSADDVFVHHASPRYWAMWPGIITMCYVRYSVPFQLHGSDQTSSRSLNAAPTHSSSRAPSSKLLARSATTTYTGKVVAKGSTFKILAQNVIVLLLIRLFHLKKFYFVCGVVVSYSSSSVPPSLASSASR